MKTRTTAAFGLGLIIVMTGCASDSCYPRRPLFPNQPIRSTLRSWFTQGDACNTCNPPVGQPNCGTNVAPLCDTCGQGQVAYPQASAPVVNDYAQPAYSQPVFQQQPVINEPQLMTPVDLGAPVDPGPVSGSETEPGVLPPTF